MSSSELRVCVAWRADECAKCSPGNVGTPELTNDHPHLMDNGIVWRAILCGPCDEDNAYVVASKGNRGQYGHCLLCDHHVTLGTFGEDWMHGPRLREVHAELHWADKP